MSDNPPISAQGDLVTFLSRFEGKYTSIAELSDGKVTILSRSFRGRMRRGMLEFLLGAIVAPVAKIEAGPDVDLATFKTYAFATEAEQKRQPGASFCRS